MCVLQRGQQAELGRSILKETSEKMECIKTETGGLCKRVCGSKE